MAEQSPLYLASQDPRIRQLISDAYAGDSVGRLQQFIEEWAYQTSIEDYQRLRQEWEHPPAPKPNTTYFGGQYIPRRLLAHESLESASFLTKSGGFVDLPNVLISTEYKISYISAKVLKDLGHDFIPTNVRISKNPRGGIFRPIGYCTIVRKGLTLPPQPES